VNNQKIKSTSWGKTQQFDFETTNFFNSIQI